MLDDALPPTVKPDLQIGGRARRRLYIGRINLEVRQSLSARYQALILGCAV
jgi:hypothetical protein